MVLYLYYKIGLSGSHIISNDGIYCFMLDIDDVKIIACSSNENNGQNSICKIFFVITRTHLAAMLTLRSVIFSKINKNM